MSEELMCTEGTTKFLGPFQILDEVDEGLTNETEEGVTKNADSHEKEGASGENTIVEKESDIKKSPESKTEPSNFIQQNAQEETTCEKQSLEETSCEDKTEKKDIGEENIIVEKELDAEEPPKSETDHNLIQENHQEEQTTCEKQSPEEAISCDDKTEKKGIGEENMIAEKESDVQEPPKSETEHNNLIQENFQEEKTICKKQSPEETISHEDDTDLKCLDNDLLKNDSINPEETNINKPIEEDKEDEKSIKSCHTEEGKEDSLSVSHEDEISIKSCQDDLTIDLCEESDVAISENVDDKDEEDQEEPKNCHPYSFMIESFELTKEQKTQTKIGPPKSLTETPVRMVNSRIGLLKLLPVLNSAKEIALRMQMDNNQFEPSIQLMAISTRDTDYIIDVAKVNKELLLLTEVFINPKIVKIIYGAARVLSTLQNVLHLYVINIFDCESAGIALQTGLKSVDRILQKEYSYILVNGMRQVDCRSRPLSPRYQDYCRAIPHYLIYVYHDYKNKLLSKDENLYKELMAKFREACKIVYPPYRVTQLLSLEEELQNHHKCQLEVLEKLNEWRNDTAIKLNINPVTIIPKPHMITLSSTLPVTEFSLCCISKSPFVKDDAEKILTIIKEVRGKYHLEEKKLKSSRKKIQDFKYLLSKELDGSNINVNPRMSNKFGKPNFQKVGQVAASRGRNRPGIKHRKKQGFTPKSQQNTNYKTVNEGYSPGFNYFKQAAPVQDFSNNWNGGAAGGRSSGASNSYNESKNQKRGNAFKRKISNMHGQSGENHNPRKKWK